MEDLPEGALVLIGGRVTALIVSRRPGPPILGYSGERLVSYVVIASGNNRVCRDVLHISERDRRIL